jgi:Tfp pilus assembly protein FimT
VTLTELLVVVAIVALIVLVVVPNVAEWLRSYKVRTAAGQVQAEMRLARTVAVSLNSSVSVLVKPAEVSWTDAQGRARRFVLPGGVSITNLTNPGAGDTFVFLRNGQIQDATRTLTVDGWVHDDVHEVWTLDFSSAGKIGAGHTTQVVPAAEALGGGGGGGGAGGGERRIR